MNREDFKNLLQQQALQVTSKSSAKSQPEEFPKGCSMCGYTGFVRAWQECNSGIGWFDSLFSITRCPYCNEKK